MAVEIKLNLSYPGGGSAESLTVSKIAGNFWERLALGFRDAGSVLVDQIKLNLSGPGRGPAPTERSRAIHQDRRHRAALFGLGREPFSRLNNFPGIVSGTLRRSVKHKLRGSGAGLAVIVGPNTVYAARQEFGYDGTQPVTPKMRRFLHAIGIHLSKSTTTIRSVTPPRPYVWPAYERRRQDVVDRIAKRIMGG